MEKDEEQVEEEKEDDVGSMRGSRSFRRRKRRMWIIKS